MGLKTSHRPTRSTETTHVIRDHTIARGKRAHLLLPHPVIEIASMYQHQGLALPAGGPIEGSAKAYRSKPVIC